MALLGYETPCGQIEPIPNSVLTQIDRWTGDVPYAVQMTDSDWPGYNASGKSWAYRIDGTADHNSGMGAEVLDRWHWFAFTFKVHDTDSGAWMIAKNGRNISAALNHVGLALGDTTGETFRFILYMWNYDAGGGIENPAEIGTSGSIYDPSAVHRVTMAIKFWQLESTIMLSAYVYYGSNATPIITVTSRAPDITNSKTWYFDCVMSPSEAEMIADKDSQDFGCDYGHFYWCDDTGSDHNVNPLDSYNVISYPCYADTPGNGRDDYVQINTVKGGAKYHQVDDDQGSHDETNDCVGTELAVEEQMFKMASKVSGTPEKLSIVASTYRRSAGGGFDGSSYNIALAAVYSYGDGGDDWGDFFDYLSISLKFNSNPASGYQYVYFQVYAMVLGDNTLDTPDDNASTPDHSDVAPVGAISSHYRGQSASAQVCGVFWTLWDTPDSPIPEAAVGRRVRGLVV